MRMIDADKIASRVVADWIEDRLSGHEGGQEVDSHGALVSLVARALKDAYAAGFEGALGHPGGGED